MKKIIVSTLILLGSVSFAFAQMTPYSPMYPEVNQQMQQNAQSGQKITNLKTLVDAVIDYINLGIYLLIALATVFFVYNIVNYFVIKTEGDRKEAGNYLMYSIIGLAVILSFWGLVNIVIKTFNLDDSRPQIERLYFKK